MKCDLKHDLKHNSHIMRLMLRLLSFALMFVLMLSLIPARADALTRTPPARRPRATPTPARPLRTMVALVFGQSNAANFGETRLTADARVSVFVNGRLLPAADPLPGADGVGGSVWTRLGNDLLTAGMYDRVVFVPVAVGGTEIADWTPEVKKHFERVEKAVRDVQAAGLQFTHLLWHQGESDAYKHIDPASYRLRFMNMLKRIRELGVTAPIYVAVATRCGPYPENADIRWVQRDLVNHDLGIWQGPDTDTLGAEFRFDGCHFSTQGLAAHAQMWVSFLK